MSKEARQKLHLGDLQVWVVAVIDGDAVRVIPDGESEPLVVRLGGIDSPESNQKFGPEATALLSDLALCRSLPLEVYDTDRYGRSVGVPHDGNWLQSINKEMVEQGLAYNWPRYGMLYGGHNAQRRAKSERIGIWQRHGGEVRPWNHRHGGVLTPIEFMEAKVEEEFRAKEKAERDARIKAALGEQA